MMEYIPYPKWITHNGETFIVETKEEHEMITGTSNENNSIQSEINISENNIHVTETTEILVDDDTVIDQDPEPEPEPEKTIFSPKRVRKPRLRKKD